MPLDKAQLEELRRLLTRRQESLADAAGVSKPPAKKKKTKKDAKKKTKKKAKKKVSKKKTPIEASLLNELKEVEGALKRLEVEEFRFGYCEKCFMEIPWRELVINAARRHCSRCS